MSFDKEMMKALEADGEKLRQLTGKDHGPHWKDPTCQKCGIVLGNRMSYVCGHTYCPSGLN